MGEIGNGIRLDEFISFLKKTLPEDEVNIAVFGAQLLAKYPQIIARKMWEGEKYIRDGFITISKQYELETDKPIEVKP